MEKNSETIAKIKIFTDAYNYKDINYPSGKDEEINFEKNNPKIAVIVLYTEKEKICPGCLSKRNSKDEDQVILLIVSSKGEWHYLTVKKQSTSLRGITYLKSGNVLFIIHANLRSLIKKADGCEKSPENYPQ